MCRGANGSSVPSGRVSVLVSAPRVCTLSMHAKAQRLGQNTDAQARPPPPAELPTLKKVT